MKEIGKKILIIILFIVVFALALWIIWDNQRIVVTPFEVESEELPESFDGYRIVKF